MAFVDIEFSTCLIKWIEYILTETWNDNHLLGIYLLKFNSENTRAMWDICSKLTINTPELRKKSVHTEEIVISQQYEGRNKMCYLSKMKKKTTYKIRHIVYVIS